METPGKSKGEMLAEVSKALVHLHTEHFGKGPTRAKTYALDDMLVCVLHEGLTTLERTLIDSGRGETVYEIRRSFDNVRSDASRSVVEKATGRTVTAYMSQIHVDPDFVVEIFVLDPPVGDAGTEVHELESSEASDA